jgi:hypothetical protein
MEIDELKTAIDEIISKLVDIQSDIEDITSTPIRDVDALIYGNNSVIHPIKGIDQDLQDVIDQLRKLSGADKE